MKFIINNFKTILLIFGLVSFIAHAAEKPANDSSKAVDYTRLGETYLTMEQVQEQYWIEQLQEASKIRPRSLALEKSDRILSQIPQDMQASIFSKLLDEEIHGK